MISDNLSKPAENTGADSGSTPSGKEVQKPLQQPVQHPSRAAKPQPNVAIKSAQRGNLKK